MTTSSRFWKHARNWETLGTRDPLFGVLSDPAKLGGKWEVDEFFESGRAHVLALARALDDLKVSYGKQSCLDFGCGVGRLTFPLARMFDRTVGVDVAPSMIDRARAYVRPGDRCEFLVNRTLELEQFEESTFDVVHSCLVLQHVPPENAITYIREFFRVCKPDGLVVFQLPSAVRSETVNAAPRAMLDSAYAASITVSDPPASIGSSRLALLRLTVINESPVAWDDLPGREIAAGNHWLHADGALAARDDGRAPLPLPLPPKGRAALQLTVQAPAAPGPYLLEIDLVHEWISWFAEKGSKTVRIGVTVTDAGIARPQAAAGASSRMWDFSRWESRIQQILSRLRRGSPRFEMYVIPRPTVEQVVRACGGRLICALEDHAAGPRWRSYTYICRAAPAPTA